MPSSHSVDEPKLNERASKYQCPADFVSFSNDCCVSTQLKDMSPESTELWLIKAPASFDPKCLSGLKLPLSSLKMVQSSGTAPKIYSILGGVAGAADLRLITTDPSSHNMSLSATPFAGVLNISENYGNCSGNQGPVAIPATPAPCIPAGLRQRFQPFGSATPTKTSLTTTQESSLSSPAPKKIKVESGMSEERKRKKKKKDKHREDEENAEVTVKEEEMSQDHSQLQASVLSVEEETEEKRKKKKKKDKHREEEDNAEVTVKEEKMSLDHSQLQASVISVEEKTEEKRKKKKKRKMKEKDSEADQMTPMDCANIETKEEPLDIAINDAQSSGKKKKKIKNE
ncbi:DNA-directed RNA polymerase I subunit RPA34 [Chanos chanos]|uniref:DNA-directed RNA polymerase I subunit RPA34 n=1 Tax=Chanos chanos TaxID=29144 RepID=A0A6J2VQN0_CHACN|nr:DNA-directed RNA polymerase I subunit RPA34 [Chanos chanos]